VQVHVAEASLDMNTTAAAAAMRAMVNYFMGIPDVCVWQKQAAVSPIPNAAHLCRQHKMTPSTVK
jgi:hypothetical protein